MRGGRPPLVWADAASGFRPASEDRGGAGHWKGVLIHPGWGTVWECSHGHGSQDEAVACAEALRESQAAHQARVAR